MIGIYTLLNTLSRQTGDDPRSVETTLRWLHRELGEEAYRRGEVPPPYSAKYADDFKRWLANKERSGILTVDDIHKARMKEREMKEKAKPKK